MNYSDLLAKRLFCQKVRFSQTRLLQVYMAAVSALARVDVVQIVGSKERGLHFAHELRLFLVD